MKTKEIFHDQKVAAARAHRYVMAAINELEKAFDHEDSMFLEINYGLKDALDLMGYLLPLPDTTSKKNLKRALYWKLHDDPLAASGDLKRCSYIWEDLKKELGVSLSDWDFVIEIFQQWIVAKLAQSNTNKGTGGKEK